MNRSTSMDRRAFLRRTGLVTGSLACGPLLAKPLGRNVSLFLDPADPIVASPAVQWATTQLQQVLVNAGFTVRRVAQLSPAGENGLLIVASGSAAPRAVQALQRAAIARPERPESLALLATTEANQQAILACGADARGLTYALCELADRVHFSSQPEAALRLPQPVAERPLNRARSVMRQFTSELLDKPWFYDREMWPRYLSMLAAQRFNRFHLAFGLGYDSLDRVEDSYFLFLYPFLLSVPGYRVRATNLPDAERDRNLETLRFISEQTAACGMDFQLGVWMHGFRWRKSDRVQNTIEGLTDANHAPYCRDALTAVLQACPAISSVALRIHGESGIAEGSYEFWKTIFEGVRRCGRTVELDLHAKGIDTTMIGLALDTGMPVNVAPKFSAEHLGMPYHQAAIRDLEMPVAGRTGAGLMTLSEGARVFTRYGYADLLRDDRKYAVRYRVFSGTQRILLWGDPAAAAAYSRMFQFCGSEGADLMEPLTCRGRRGSAKPGNRDGYGDSLLEPRWDWEKYAYWYRVWGRLMYNPETSPEVWRRQFGDDDRSRSLESALASASRILPIVTMAHLPSAACDAYWPEIYWNQPLAGEAPKNPYSDTPAPKVFQNVSPLDPQMFSRISDFAQELLTGAGGAKYSPVEVAAWLEDFAVKAERELSRAGVPVEPERRRVAIDVEIQTALGRFFAAKFRAGVLYAIHERTGDRRALEEALKAYGAARGAWVQAAERAKGVYAIDLSVSDRFTEHGQWLDRIAEIDRDIAQMQLRLDSARVSPNPKVAGCVDQVLRRPRRESKVVHHQPPPGFRRKVPVTLEITQEQGGGIGSAKLYYRHVNQAERFQVADMESRGNQYHGQIPPLYTDSPYPLQYYFELRDMARRAWLYPGLGQDLLNQPYFVLRHL